MSKATFDLLFKENLKLNERTD